MKFTATATQKYALKALSLHYARRQATHTRGAKYYAKYGVFMKGHKTMKQAKVNYKKKCKSRKVDFYLHEQDLYNFSKSINFSKFVKKALRNALQYGVGKDN